MINPEKKNKRGGFAPQDNAISILPSVAAGVITLAFITIVTALGADFENETERKALILVGAFGCIYLCFFYFIFRSAANKKYFMWSNTIVSCAAIALIIYVIPATYNHLVFALLFITSIAASLIADRGSAYFTVVFITVADMLLQTENIRANNDLGLRLIFALSAVVGVETIQQLKNIARNQINRLEIVNDLSQQLVSTIETKQVFTLLNAVFQNAIEADAYYIGVSDGDEILLELFYDEGEYFNGMRLKKKGTLSNWVIKNQAPLFLPDLRNGIDLEDVENVVIGQEKPTISWMGVPMRGAHINGVMAISSYKPNAFDRSDLELLSSIAQRAAFALDNAHHHAQVEEQAQIDSLTKVYNHGSFIKKLQEQSETCLAQNQPLSVIMLDIDFFKQYNDTFGHMIGDEILVSLCNIIRSHIKATDAAGRWGGEEFAISLPNANAEQAMQIAQRIQKSMASIKIRNEKQITIRVPTVSQGIAVFPRETKNIHKLIDIADKRLYRAKERGRDQIEPAPEESRP